MANWNWDNCGEPLKGFIGLVKRDVLSADKLKCPGFLNSLSEEKKDAMTWLVGQVSPVLDDYLFQRSGLSFGNIKFDNAVLSLLKFSEDNIPEFANILNEREASGAKKMNPFRHINTFDVSAKEVDERLALPCMN